MGVVDLFDADSVKQISDLIQFLYQNSSDKLGTNEYGELIDNIYNVILYGLFEEKSNEDTVALANVINSKKLDLKDFSYYAGKCLLKYCTDKLVGYESEPLAIQVENLNYKIWDMNRLLGYQDEIRDIYNKKYNVPSERFKGKGVVYSVITGGYDCLYEPNTEGSNVDYIMLTDSQIEGYSGKWKIRKIDNPLHLSAKELSRWVKMHPSVLFSEYDWSVYVDGSVQIQKPLDDLVTSYAKKSGIYLSIIIYTLCLLFYRSRTMMQKTYHTTFLCITCNQIVQRFLYLNRSVNIYRPVIFRKQN